MSPPVYEQAEFNHHHGIDQIVSMLSQAAQRFVSAVWSILLLVALATAVKIPKFTISES